MITIKIPVDEDRLAVIYTQDVCTENELRRIRNFAQSINWNKEYVMVPSEYIKGIKFIRRRKI